MKFAISLLVILSLTVDFGVGRRRHHRYHWSRDEDEEGPSGGYNQQELYSPEDDQPHDHRDLKWIEAGGKTAHLAASAAIEKSKSIPHLAEGIKHNIISTIKLAILAQVDGLHALKGARKAHRLGHNRLANFARRRGNYAIVAGKKLLSQIKIYLLKCLQSNLLLLQNFFGVDVASLFEHSRDSRDSDPRLALKAAYLANKAEKAAYHAKERFTGE